MRIRKKMMVVLSVLATGASSAFYFRRDAHDVDSAADGGPFGQRVERRVPAGAAWVRKMNAQQAQRVPAPATASIGSDGVAEPTFQKSFNPVGALLEPIDGVPPDDEPEGAAAAPAAAQPTDISDVPRTHVVADGDTLSRLAVQYLGRSDRYLEIFELNRPLLSSPDLLPIGASLKIPPRTVRDPARPVPGSYRADEAPPGDAPLRLVPVPNSTRP